MKYIYIFYSINEDSHACVFKETHFTLIGNTSLNKLHIKKCAWVNYKNMNKKVIDLFVSIIKACLKCACLFLIKCTTV